MDCSSASVVYGEKILPAVFPPLSQECAGECRDRCDPQKDQDVLLVFYLCACL